MRILHLDSGRQMRGGQYQVLALLDGLRAAGHECLLLAREGAPLAQAERTRGFAVEPLGLWRIARRSRAVDLVHAHDAHAHTLAALACTRPLVVARRVAFPMRDSVISIWKYARAGYYIAVSECVKNTLVDAGVDAARIDVVYDGVEPRPATVAGSRVVSLYSDDPGKGMALVRAAAERAEVEVDFARDLNSALQRARLFIYITSSEGLGSAVLAAMAAGVPVVASRVGGLPEIVVDNETGVLTGNAPDQIARAMRRLLDDPALAARCAAQARARVEKEFTVDRMVCDTLRVYQRLLAC
jgi:glycosyltransferase involved in cell wall biosynthesis